MTLNYLRREEKHVQLAQNYDVQSVELLVDGHIAGSDVVEERIRKHSDFSFGSDWTVCFHLKYSDRDNYSKSHLFQGRLKKVFLSQATKRKPTD
jgi:hypothetical protein